MRRSKREKQPSIPQIHNDSNNPSPRCSSAVSDCDADDEGFMSSKEQLTRPLSLSISSGPYCPRRPTLREVLSNDAPPPWTLSAFMAYLSQNHCLETLEFTMDASRYRKHYETYSANAGLTHISPSTEGCDYLRMLWRKLLDAYIIPNGPREVNLPADVRDRLLSAPNRPTPPHPERLREAVDIVYELMDESALVPFLNETAAKRATLHEEKMQSPTADTTTISPTNSYDTASHPSFSAIQRERSPISASDISRSFSTHASRLSGLSHLSPSLARGRTLRVTQVSSGGEGADAGMTDDSTGTESPSIKEPITPPITPPTSDSLGAIPMDEHPKLTRDDSGWKRMGERVSARLGLGGELRLRGMKRSR
jgi:hypothetical protein